jgi:hypothetical protein
MKHPRIELGITVGILMACGAATSAAARNSSDPDVIIEWNQIAQRTIGGPPFSQTRQYAMVHTAMADAVVAIEGRFWPFHARIQAPSGASAEAAAAQAAHDVLLALAPGAQATLDAALAASLAGIPPGRRATGVKAGQKAAAAILSWRQADGFAAANPQPPAFLTSTLPGIWKPTASGPAQFSELGSVQPFGLVSPTQFLPAPPPQLESTEYATDFNEVKNKGRATGSTRLPEQTRFAQLFASAGPYVNATTPFRLWSNVARDVAEQRHYSLAETARLFALMTASIHDGVQTAHTSKFVYRLWRPETAIDQAGIDQNGATAAESAWPPLLVTPPYPSHASNMACIGASAARILENVSGSDNANFAATWYSTTTPATVVHSQPYSSFSALSQDEGDSRIWGGIHFRFEITASQISCTQVADYLFDHYMRPIRMH